MPAIVNTETCTGCEACPDSCPVEAIVMENDVAVIDVEACSDCGACVDVCPVEAISLD